MTSAYLRELEKFESGDGHYREDFSIWDSLASIVAPVIPAIAPIAPIAQIVSSIDPVKSFVDGITAPVKNTITGIEDKVKGTVETVINVVKDDFNKVKDGFNDVKIKIENGAHDLEEKAVQVAGQVIEKTENLISDELNDIENSAIVKKGVNKLIKQPLHEVSYAFPIAGLFAGSFCARFFPGAEFIDGYLEKNTTWYVRGLFSLLIIMVIAFMFFAVSYRVWHWSSTDPTENTSPAAFLVNTVIAPITLTMKAVTLATQKL